MCLQSISDNRMNGLCNIAEAVFIFGYSAVKYKRFLNLEKTRFKALLKRRLYFVPDFHPAPTGNKLYLTPPSPPPLYSNKMYLNPPPTWYKLYLTPPTLT